MTAMDDFDPASRELCPDGSCIGLIGPDGRCKVCGALSPNDRGPYRKEDVVEVKVIDVEPDLPAGQGEALEVDDDDFAARRLCPDGSCIGVIGASGRCKVCGTPAS
jgi:hypothetical protein